LLVAPLVLKRSDFPQDAEKAGGGFEYYSCQVSTPEETVMKRSEHPRSAAVVFALAFVAIFPTTLLAQEDGGHAASSGGHHANHAGLFLGLTRAGGHSSFTIGADFERRLPIAHERFAVGALVDAAVGPEPKHVIVAGTLSFRPVATVKLLIAPGVEFAQGHSEELFRAGAAIDIAHVGPLMVSPGLFFDFVGGHTAIVFGLTFGAGF
jgi:hypothetical protein